MERRDFLKGLGTLVVADALSPAFPFNTLARQTFGAAVDAAAGLSILQGVTTDTTTQLTVDLPKNMKVEYSLKHPGTGKVLDPEWVRGKVNSNSSTRVDRIFFTGLDLGVEYQFSVSNISRNKILDERILSVVDVNKADARIAVLSCMRDSSSAKGRMWKSALAANPDYFFFIGDVIYGDSMFSSGPDKLWSRFIESRASIPFYRWKKLKPAIGVWDDHDYGKNNEDGSYPHKEKTLKIFKAFFGQEQQDGVFEAGPGNSYCLKAFEQNFLFLDSRYFRGLKSNGIKGFLGQQQMDWASDQVSGSARPTWIMEGSPFFGRVRKSKTSYQATASQELERFLKEVSKWNSPALFMGGDVHYSEISKMDKKYVGYQTYELISSCMHSSTKSGYYDNPNPRVQSTLKENFLLLEKQGRAEDPSWKVSSIGENSRVLFSGSYQID